ncbi:MAG: Fe-S protein assembly co-chaperone HscB [Rhodocyclaceae bacterium]|nr:Fe-S protein assembly co-chaperone HscB [Rhodocyclaceae bacterium]
MTDNDLFSATGDHFSLFGLPRQQALDGAELARRYEALIARAHPDKHAHLTAEAQRRAMEWAARVNEAYATLKDPLRRAIYLLHLAGHDARLDTHTAMPMEFLAAQMEAREAVEEARAKGDLTRLEDLYRSVRGEIGRHHGELVQAIDDGRYETAAQLIRRLMFEEKLKHEIDAAIAEIEG